MKPPSPGAWRNRYGPRINPVTGVRENHHGLDIGDESGALLVAPARCRLIGYGVVPGWEVHGRVARLLDEDGYVHWLSHTDHLVLGLNVGDELDEGDPVAMQGMTGQTTGRHVHWETRLNGERLDPEAWLARPQALDPEPLPIPERTRRKEPAMLLAMNTKKTAPQEYMLFGETGMIQIFTGDTAARGFEAQIGAPAVPVGQSFVDAQVRKANAVDKVQVVNADEFG